jgi:1-acyl-sn-glycerol-3-phosphate acyltransferase
MTAHHTLGFFFLPFKSDAPIQPIAYFGAENYRHDLVNLKRISFKIKVGDLFKISLETERISQQLRYQITDEIMIQIARLLPPSYRGVYSHRVDEQPRYLQKLYK